MIFSIEFRLASIVEIEKKSGFLNKPFISRLWMQGLDMQTSAYLYNSIYVRHLRNAASVSSS